MKVEHINWSSCSDRKFSLVKLYYKGGGVKSSLPNINPRLKVNER